jgi:guanine nucleotide-binding protein subunit alpha
MQLVNLPSSTGGGGGGNNWSRDIGEAIKSLWLDNGIRSVFSLAGSHFQLNDSAQYFFESMDRFLDDDYTPSIDDVLRVRVRSTGIEEALFVFDKMTFKAMDVGGQRSERRKWFNCFPDVTAVLFVVALSGFDQVLREESTVNRMTESITLFDNVVNSPVFNDASIILFLNKVDLFAEKLRRGVLLSNLFPNYTGGQDFERALQFVTARFSERVNDARQLYIHRTCAIDTKKIEAVITDVRKTVMLNTINFNPST